MLGRHRARRLSQRFARVGVETPPERLQEIVSGAPAADDEMTDVNFALIAIQLNHEQRVTKFKHLQRRGRRSLFLAALVLVELNFLICVAYLLLNLAEQL